MMQLQRRNFGLSGSVLFNPDSAYDNLLGIGKKGKVKKAFKTEKKETKRANKISNMKRGQETKDSRQDRRVLNNDKRQIKNEMRTAKVDDKKVKTTAMAAGIQKPEPSGGEPPKKSDNTMMYVAAGVGVVLLAAGAFMIMKKPQVQLTPVIQPGGWPRA